MTKQATKRECIRLKQGAMGLLLMTLTACQVQATSNIEPVKKDNTTKQPPQNTQSIAERISTRTFPSIFEVWNPIENRPERSAIERMAMHDLAMTTIWTMKVNWESSAANPYKALSTTLTGNNGDKTLSEALKMRNELNALNPNLLVLCGLKYREAQFVAKGTETSEWQKGDLPYDSDLWLRDEQDNLCPGWGRDEDGNGTVELHEIKSMLIDFRKPEVHEMLANKALALKQSGIFDGIILNWWNEEKATTGRWPNWNGTHLTSAEETAARINMLQKIREKVGDDFLIMVVSNDRKTPKSAPYINGLFMECYKNDREKGYGADDIARITDTLVWAENNLRPPRVNCLEGWRIVSDYNANLETRINERNSAENRQWMRLFTTLSLTHSDGYALFSDGNALPLGDHLHNWRPFWDTDLGSPTSAATQREDGAFIRPFTNGSAVYNPPNNKPLTITFDQPRKSAATGLHAKTHSISAGDGDLFLD